MSEIEVERFFSICDRGGKGYLVKEDLKVICPQLDDNDIVFIFAQLDSDGSGRIEREAFCTKFENTVMQGEKNGLDGMQRRASVIEPTNVSFSNNVSTVSRTIIENSPFQQEDEVFDSDVGLVFPLPSLTHYETDKLYDSESDTSVTVDFALPCQEEVLLLYQQLQSAGIPQLLKKFERVVGAFYKEIKEQKTENERLQHVYESERNMHHRIMEDVENELDQHLKVVEKKAREEERIKLIREKEEMRTQLAAEMRDMQENIEKLQRIETVLQQKELKNNHQRELQEKLQELHNENFELRKGLADNHLELATIKSELAHVRADYDHKKNELMRQKDEISAAVEDNQNMQKQVQLLFEANKKLHDTNDSLREALDSRATLLRQFNLRTPLPLIFRDGMDSACTANCITSEGVKLFSTTSACKFALEDDIVSFDGNSSHNSDQPKDDIVPSIGFHPATGPAERTFRVVMCGDAAVGKSSLVLRLISGKHANNLPSTLGIDFHVKTVGIDGRNVALQLWDTAGQERFRSLCKSYFRRADGAILVYDVTSERSFLRIREWIDTINESVERHIPVVLVGNKTDLRLREDEGIPTKDGSALAASVEILFMETSAVDGSNVETTILTLAREMIAVEDVEVRAAGVILSPRTRHSAGCFSKCSKS